MKEVIPEELGDVSVRCISDHLAKDLKYKSYRAKVKPLITEKNRKDRLSFCREYRGWSLGQWRAVLWSDESTFSVSAGNKTARVPRGHRAEPNHPK